MASRAGMDRGRSQQGLRGPPKALINLSSGDITCLWRPFADPVYPQYWIVTALGLGTSSIFQRREQRPTPLKGQNPKELG